MRLIAVLILLALPCPSFACSLCGSVIKRNTFGQEFERARVVLSGRVVASRFSDDPRTPGAGTSDFVIEKVLKDDPVAAGLKRVEINGAIPVLDIDKPPRFVVFFDVVKGKLHAVHGREVRSEALLDYLDKAQAARARKDRVAALLSFARWLDHEDDAIAEDAFLEFAKSEDVDVGEAARELDPALFRKLIESPRTPPDRLSLYAFLLAGKKDESQADFLKKLIDRPSDRMREALDGLLCGYIALKPKEGWDKVTQLLGDAKQPFTIRNNVIRTVRFYYNWKPKETRPEMLRAFKGLVETDLADMAIEDLRRWKVFDLSELIYRQYARPGFDAPIIRRSIIRYAVVARANAEQRAGAERFIKTLSAADQPTLREAEESLALEK